MCYQTKRCGVSFRWNMFGMTSKDSDNLASGLKTCRKLKRFAATNSKVDDDKFYAIYDGLRNVNRLGEEFGN